MDTLHDVLVQSRKRQGLTPQEIEDRTIHSKSIDSPGMSGKTSMYLVDGQPLVYGQFSFALDVSCRKCGRQNLESTFRRKSDFACEDDRCLNCWPNAKYRED